MEFILIFAAIFSVAILLRRLPLQNVIALALLIAVISGAGEILATLAGFPSVLFSHDAKLFGIVPWPMPLLWMVLILNARALAKKILQRWRAGKKNGFELLIVASLLAAALFSATEMFFSGKWNWKIFASQFSIAALLLIWATPWLI